ncbi:MAG: signal peptidase I [Candidatus Zixiibacteriota bacterium]
MDFNETQYGNKSGLDNGQETGYKNGNDTRYDAGYETGEFLRRREVTPQRSGKKTRIEKPIWRQYVETIAIALLAALILRVFIVSAYRVSSGSMEETLTEGDFIFVNKLAYNWSPPQASDIIVFENPFEESKDFIKRIAAVEGQTVEIIDKVLYVDGQVAPIPPMSKHIDYRIFPSVLSNRDNFGPMMVPANQVFVLGDNRDDSQDSRFWGCLDKRYIKGKAVFVYFSYAPDPSSPEWKAPYIGETFEIIWHNLKTFPTRMRLDRLGSLD